MNKFSHFFAFICIFLALGSQAVGQEVLVDVDTKEDIKKSGERPKCKFTFTLTNKSFGTIYNFEAKIAATDDRGRPVDSYGFARVVNKQSYKSIPIKKGDTVSRLRGATFREECKYIKKLSIASVKEEDCSIRMHPESTTCRSIVRMNGDESKDSNLVEKKNNPQRNNNTFSKKNKNRSSGIYSRLVPGHKYKNYTDNSCRTGKTEHCISSSEYKELCQKAQGFTRYVRSTTAIMYTGSFAEFLRSGGNFNSGGIRWIGSSCRASFTISGLYRGTMTRKAFSGRVSMFVFNSSKQLLVHSVRTF
jgi:hypothetical protein